jgi:hypothetical protein
MQQMPGQTAQAFTLVRTDKLIGKTIKDTQGQNIGKIEDLVLTPDCRTVSYIALSSDGKYYAVPWAALQPGQNDTYTLSISKQDLTKAQAFKEDQWPAQANTQLLSQSQGAMSSYRQGTASSRQGTTSSRQGAESSQPGMAQSQPSAQSGTVEQRRVTKLTDVKVKDKEGADVGKIHAFVANLGGASSGPISGQARAAGSPASINPTSTANRPPTANAEPNQTGRERSQWSSRAMGAAPQIQNGQLIFTVLSVGGVLDLGEKYSLVPSNLVQIQPARQTATLNAAKKTVESLAFSPSDFPDLSNRQYVRQVYEKFGEQPSWPALGYVPPEQQGPSGQTNQQGRTGQMNEQGQTGQSGTRNNNTPNP